MAASRQDLATLSTDGLSPRKKLRLLTNAETTPTVNNLHINKWEPWPNGALSPRSHGHGGGSSSESISLSGSGSESGSQKASPIHEGSSFLPVGCLTVALPKLTSSCAAVLNTPPVVHGELRPLLMRPPAAVDDHHSPGGAAVNVVPWSIQDFEGLSAGFDGSLSGLSDLTGPAYMNDMMEFVKRQSNQPVTNNSNNVGGENYFQYILMSPTSAAIKLNEEPLTYLNQGQSYEIKCKKLGMDSGGASSPGRLYKSLVRVGFHDRRQKFQERELLQQWKQMHTSDKLIDADVPMSYNVFNINTDPSSTYIEFVWDPTKNTSIFIRVNCISTEFTARKHGGEKGVPFRLQVDTFSCGDAGSDANKHLHSAYAQIKVFKTKGADRKNKTDRERAEKRADKEKYQPAYDYTILTETFPVDVFEFDAQQQQQQNQQQQQEQAAPIVVRTPATAGITGGGAGGQATIVAVKSRSNLAASTNGNSNCALHNDVDSVPTFRIKDEVSSQGGLSSPSPSNEDHFTTDTLNSDATPVETADWLRRQRFCNYLKTFNNFSGTDLLRLTREDLIQICGTADGIRMYNALQYKKLQPKLTLYMCVPGAPAYHAVFLISLTLAELVQKVCDLIQVQAAQIYDVYCQGPEGINVHVNNEVVQNLPDRSRFLIDAMKCGDETLECYRILLKSVGDASTAMNSTI